MASDNAEEGGWVAWRRLSRATNRGHPEPPRCTYLQSSRGIIETTQQIKCNKFPLSWKINFPIKQTFHSRYWSCPVTRDVGGWRTRKVVFNLLTWISKQSLEQSNSNSEAEPSSILWCRDTYLLMTGHAVQSKETMSVSTRTPRENHQHSISTWLGWEWVGPWNSSMKNVKLRVFSIVSTSKDSVCCCCLLLLMQSMYRAGDPSIRFVSV